MAYHLALMLYCKEEVPCYNCRECSNIIENKHLNVYYVSPLGQTIKKEQILALQDPVSPSVKWKWQKPWRWIRYTPYTGPVVYIGVW